MIFDKGRGHNMIIMCVKGLNKGSLKLFFLIKYNKSVNLHEMACT